MSDEKVKQKAMETVADIYGKVLILASFNRHSVASHLIALLQLFSFQLLQFGYSFILHR